MAPEQVTSTTRPDRRADVYGLGVLAYECLTGSTPFAGQIMEVLARLLSDAEPAPMSRYRGDVPPALEAAIHRALRRDRAARWPDAESFARACAAAIGGDFPPLHLFEGDAARTSATRAEGARRKCPRVPYRAPARLVGPAGRGGDARVEDISPGGLLLTTNEPVGENAACLVKVPLPLSGRVVVLPCLVQWVKQRGDTRAAGLEFVHLPDDARREIDHYIKPLD
jgi:hypothetical protein